MAIREELLQLVSWWYSGDIHQSYYNDGLTELGMFLSEVEKRGHVDIVLGGMHFVSEKALNNRDIYLTEKDLHDINTKDLARFIGLDTNITYMLTDLGSQVNPILYALIENEGSEEDVCNYYRDQEQAFHFFPLAGKEYYVFEIE